MAIGRTFKEALQKAIRSLEIDRYGLEETNISQRGAKDNENVIEEIIREKLKLPNWERVWYIAQAFRLGWSVEEIYEHTRIDPWFLSNIQQIVTLEEELKTIGPSSGPLLYEAKEYGFSDRRLAQLWNISEAEVRGLRKAAGIKAIFKRVDTCAAEFEAYTPYLYSTYERECEARPTKRKKLLF